MPDLTQVPQLVLSGLVSGAIYAIVGLGFVVINKATGVVNFGQGEAVTVGGYVALVLWTSLALPAYVVFPLVMLSAALLGVIIERAVCRPLLGSPVFTMIVATLAVGFTIKSIIRIVFGPTHYGFPPMFGTTRVNLGPATTTSQNLWIIGIVFGMMILLFAFFKYTNMGKAMRATSQNRTAAALMGVSVKGVFSMTWALGTVLGAIGGTLLAPLIVLSPDIGTILLKAFSASILGGFESLPGTILGGTILGIVETMSGYYVSSAAKDIIAFALIIVVVILRPQGLLGKPVRKRV